MSKPDRVPYVPYIADNLLKAVRHLVSGRSEIQVRLEEVKPFLIYISIPSYRFPQGLQERFDRIMTKIRDPAFGQLDEEEYSAIAREIFSLWYDYMEIRPPQAWP